MIDLIKRLLKDWYHTLSSKASFLSSKRIERFAFTSTSIGLVIGTFIYLVVNKQLTASDTIILISPLLVAAGYNLSKTEEAKKNKEDGEV